ncbi:hypothetical protein, partial [Blastomonas sp.]|uniref:hypothetical protein n=1 Tax=Blastomonas sp. TaxID=1909299 RepID=UPI003919261C
MMDPLITADDVIRAGACRGGVYKRAEQLAGKIAAAEPLSRLLKLLPVGERDYARPAAGHTRVGSGSGDGFCDGDGAGSG